MRRKVGLVLVFTHITKIGDLPEKASIHTDIKVALKETYKREDKRWVIYADSKFYAVH